MTVIADDTAARGIAGVMGGEETGCTETTTNVFIESAWFDPVRTAQTGRKLGILSDARYRFERGVDPEFVVPGLELATQWILELCGGEASRNRRCGRSAAVAPRNRVRYRARAVAWRHRRAESRNRRASWPVSVSAVKDGASLSVMPPSWRWDVEGAADLVEEVVRIHGLDKVPSEPLARSSAVARATLTPSQRRTRIVRRTLAARGFNETITFAFIPRAHARLFGGGDDARQLENPIAADLDAMRPSRAAVAARGGAAQPGARIRRADAVRDRRAVRERHARSASECCGGNSRRRRRAFVAEIRARRGRLRRQGRHAGCTRRRDGCAR